MASKQGGESPEVEILRDMLVVQLLSAGVRQHDVRAIAKCGMGRVVAISRALRGRKAPDASDAQEAQQSE
jgi:hypothetical protein